MAIVKMMTFVNLPRQNDLSLLFPFKSPPPRHAILLKENQIDDYSHLP